MSSTPNYSVRVNTAELKQLKEWAKREGVTVSDAMRLGARMYLSATPEEREGTAVRADIDRASTELATEIERARMVLRSWERSKEE